MLAAIKSPKIDVFEQGLHFPQFGKEPDPTAKVMNRTFMATLEAPRPVPKDIKGNYRRLCRFSHDIDVHGEPYH